ncbi:aconitase family protein [Streptomyces sp. M10(2022)]
MNAWARPDALTLNMRREYELNNERYRFLRWAQREVDGLRVVPPGKGIVHQMHLEHLARVVMTDTHGMLACDSVLGTDSHTPWSAPSGCSAGASVASRPRPRCSDTRSPFSPACPRRSADG